MTEPNRERRERVRAEANRRLGTPLTKEDVALIPTGELVIVTWSGGNGPHVYHTRRFGGCLWAYHDDHPVGALDPVGEHPLTRVWRATAANLKRAGLKP